MWHFDLIEFISPAPLSAPVFSVYEDFCLFFATGFVASVITAKNSAQRTACSQTYYYASRLPPAVFQPTEWVTGSRELKRFRHISSPLMRHKEGCIGRLVFVNWRFQHSPLSSWIKQNAPSVNVRLRRELSGRGTAFFCCCLTVVNWRRSGNKMNSAEVTELLSQLALSCLPRWCLPMLWDAKWEGLISAYKVGGAYLCL